MKGIRKNDLDAKGLKRLICNCPEAGIRRECLRVNCLQALK